MNDWNKQYRDERGGGPQPWGPRSGGYWQGKADRERAEWAESQKNRGSTGGQYVGSEPRRTKPRQPSARELRRRANPPPDYPRLRRASNVLAGVMFVIFAGIMSYESFASDYALDEKVVVPLVTGLFGALLGKAPLMMLRWALRAIWDPPA